MEERVLAVGELPLVDGPCDVLWADDIDGDNPQWRHSVGKGVCMLFHAANQGDADGLRREIVDKAVALGATGILWTEEPEQIVDIACAVYSLYRKAE